MGGRLIRAGRKRTTAYAVVLFCLATTLGGCSLGEDEGPSGDPVTAAAGAYLQLWSAGDTAGAAAATDDPAAAKAALDEVADSLRVTAIEAIPGAVEAGKSADAPGEVATVPVEVTLTLDGLGLWGYATTLTMEPVAETGDWTVRWALSAVHPALTEQTRLGRTRTLLPRAPILDARGVALTTERPVIALGIEPGLLTDPPGLYAALSEANLGVDIARLADRVAAAPRPDVLVPVVTVRTEAYEAVRPLLDKPGLLARPAMRTLAPTPTFGRGLLGSVGPATAETIEAAGPLTLDTDEIGLSGLQESYGPRLAGEPAGEVRLLDRATDEVVEVLNSFSGKPGEALRTTIETSAQSAAESALSTVGDATASLVAVRASTGEVLAAANTPATAANPAFEGRYPPGSTFKVVTTATLLAGRLDPAQTVPCPAQVVVEGKRFTNAGGLALGDVAFRQDFAQSCNTAFVALSRALPADALAAAAPAFGLGVKSDLGLPAFRGSVPSVPGSVERAAAAIGQGRVLASPLSMAGVAAAVASGQTRPPVLLPDLPVNQPSAAAPTAASMATAPTASPPSASDPRAAASATTPLDPAVAETLRSLMHEVVQTGSGTALADVPGGPVGAKTGTAEYGSDAPPRTHAWIIGFRDDVAFAVLIEDGGSGGRAAGPVAAAFLRGLDAAQN